MPVGSIQIMNIYTDPKNVCFFLTKHFQVAKLKLVAKLYCTYINLQKYTHSHILCEILR